MKKPLHILCVADEVDLLVYSSQICERFSDIDLVLSAGDLPNEYLEYIASMLNKPLISVAGNHDRSDEPADYRGGLHYYSIEQRGGLGRIRFSMRKESGIRVLGLPGSIRYNDGQNQYTDTWMTFRIIQMLPWLLVRRLLFGRSVDIILAHSPPRGIHDGGDPAHVGFSAYRWLIRLARPYYFIHGHVHLYDLQALREMDYFDTSVVNVYGHRVITLPKESSDGR
jgi:calcineurin-like phosphoesterase family protein